MSTRGRHRRIAVIGGGWAGMTCAVVLADAGCRVTVFEAAATLGGRARRIAHDGDALDNGQHLLLGAYRRTLAMIDHVHPEAPRAALYARTPLCLAGPGAFRLQARRLPSPWHTIAGLLTASGCSWLERLAVARAFLGWHRAGWRCDPTASVTTLLAAQPHRIVALLWRPICIAALNTPPDDASAQVFLNVLHDGLARLRSDSDLIVPSVDLSRLFPEPAAAHVAARNGAVRTNSMVREVVAASDEIAVRLRDGEHAGDYDAAVVATGPAQASRLLATIGDAAAARRAIDAYRYLPICTMYLGFEDLPSSGDDRMFQLAGEPGQWAFELRGATDVTAGVRQPNDRATIVFAVVVSADAGLRAAARDELCSRALAQLRAARPSLRSRTPLWCRIIVEKRATFACTPLRDHPDAGPIGARVFIAGDHTDPDYPATLEAAVRSGERAAQAVLACA